jgi:uncharacterized SAM-binding protein YcdF (DUF218 family)
MGDLFFVASKLGWGAMRVDSVILLMLFVGLLALWVGWIGLGRGLVSVAVAALAVIVLTPLGGLLLRGLESRYPVPEIDGPVAGIVVLGGAEDPWGMSVWRQPSVNEAGERFLVALDLAQRFPDAPLIFTGGSGRLKPAPVREAGVARDLLVGAGLDPARLILEGASRNTAENARLAAGARPKRAGQWLLVTSAFHMPRAVETFCAAGWRDLTPYPVDFRSRVGVGFSWAPAERLIELNTALHEWVGLVVYRATGRASHPLARGCLAGAVALSSAPPDA